MSSFSVKRTIGKGFLLAIPLIVIIYVLIKVIVLLKKLIEPLSKKLSIENLFGELTLTIFAIVIILVLMFILGLLMNFSYIRRFGKNMEEVVFRFVPSLAQLKTVAAEKMDIENAANTWKAVLLLYENKYTPAFIIEEEDDLVTFFVIKGTKLDEGEMLIAPAKDVTMIPITSNEMRNFSKQYGKGYISFIKNDKPLNA
jgi:uncharacterized membrane protein